jgi:hypothetical protein
LTHARQTASIKDAVYNPCFPVGYKDELTNLPGGSNWDANLTTLNEKAKEICNLDFSQQKNIKSWTLGMMLVEANKLLMKNITDEDNMIYIDLLQSYKCIIAGSTLVLLLLTSFIWRRRK